MEDGDIRNLKVSDVMHSGWPTLGKGETVEAAIKLFASENVSGVPVVEGGRLVGIVTEGDLIFRDAEVDMPGFLEILGGMIPLGDWGEYRRETMKSAGVTVEMAMTGDVTTISPEDTLSEAATVMAEKRIKLLPVTADDDPEGDRVLQGVLTRMDILTLHILDPSF